MKKRTALLLVLMLFALTSCTTLVNVKTMVPAELNLAAYDLVAVAPTDGGSSIDFNVSYKYRFSSDERKYLPSYATSTVFFTPNLSDYATTAISQAVSDCVDVFVPEYTVEKLLRDSKKTDETFRSLLLDQGIDCLITSRISGKTIDQYVDYRDSESTSSEGNTIVTRKYYLVQEATIELTVEATDVEDNTKVFTKMFQDTDERRFYIGKIETGGNFIEERHYGEDFDPEEMFEDMLLSMRYRIKKYFTQSQIQNRFFLKKAQNTNITSGISLAHEGYYKDALEAFLEAWDSGLYEGGYNASVMYFALGEFDSATELAYTTFKETGNMDARELYEELASIIDADEKAKDQLNGIETSDKNGELIGF